MSKWKVYISSTFNDLKEFRADLINLFQNQLKNNFELSEIMERMFDDGTYTPFLDDCVAAVMESDIYIIILGNKIGSFPPNEQRTYTEMELDTALANEKRIFCLRLEHFDEHAIDNKAKHNELLDKFKGRPTHSFNDSTQLRKVLLECLIPFATTSPVKLKNPYKGLASFEVADGEYFFGRDNELERCLKKIVTKPGNFFISVIGNSGTGKSSFVMAGLLFRLKTKKEYGFSKRFQIIVTPGSEPFTNLKYQLQLQGFSIDEVLKPNTKTPDLIIYFDQFEEVITQCHSTEAEEEKKELFGFLDSLAGSESRNTKVLVICSFRSDFLSQLVNYDFIKSHQYLFPLSSLDYKVHSDNWEQSLTEIITKPALKNRVTIEKELINQLLEQIKEVEGSLPILQFTLERLWSKETVADRRIDSTEYNKLSGGKGISGIIEAHAEKVVRDITRNGKDKNLETILKTIFVNLVEVNENQNDIKRTITKDELFSLFKQQSESIVLDVFETLVSEKSRLLNIGQDKDEKINVSIIHEELIRKWERLKGWIDERRVALEQKKRIILDIGAFKKGVEGLYGRRQLKTATQWKENNPDLANAVINSFLHQSRKGYNQKMYKRSGITVVLAILIATVILVFIQPAIQKRDFINDILKPNVYIYNEIRAGGGIDSISKLSITENTHNIYHNNLKHFNNLKELRLGPNPFLEDLSIIKGIKNPSIMDSLLITANKNLASLEGIGDLKNLTSLEIQGNPKLETSEGIGDLENLTSLTISSNDNLKSLEGIGGFKNLTSLTISSNDNLKSLQGIGGFKNLTSLEIGGNYGLTSLKGIGGLENLTSLIIEYNNSFETLEGIGGLKNLTSLTISGADRLKSLEGIGGLENLTSLIIEYNNSFETLESIGGLKNLTSLTISGADRLKSLEGIGGLENLTSLTIFRNDNLATLDSIGVLKNLTSLTISSNDNLKSLEGIWGLKNLNSLEILANPNLKSLEGIGVLKNLTSLTISSNPNLKSLEGIWGLKNLTSLEIGGNNNLATLDSIGVLKNLTSLTISSNDNLKSLEGIGGLKNLTSLTIFRNDNLKSLEGIGGLKNLTSLVTYYNINLATLDSIGVLKNLTSLTISGADRLKSLEGFGGLENLTSLVMYYNDKLSSLEGIGVLKKLTSLEIVGNHNLKNLEGIGGLENLTSLTISGNEKLNYLDEIEKLTKLKVLVLDGNSDIDVDLLIKNNPKLKISFE